MDTGRRPAPAWGQMHFTINNIPKHTLTPSGADGNKIGTIRTVIPSLPACRWNTVATFKFLVHNIKLCDQLILWGIYDNMSIPDIKKINGLAL